MGGRGASRVAEQNAATASGATTAARRPAPQGHTGHTGRGGGVGEGVCSLAVGGVRGGGGDCARLSCGSRGSRPVLAVPRWPGHPTGPRSRRAPSTTPTVRGVGGQAGGGGPGGWIQVCLDSHDQQPICRAREGQPHAPQRRAVNHRALALGHLGSGTAAAPPRRAAKARSDPPSPTPQRLGSGREKSTRCGGGGGPAYGRPRSGPREDGRGEEKLCTPPVAAGCGRAAHEVSPGPTAPPTWKLVTTSPVASMRCGVLAGGGGASNVRLSALLCGILHTAVVGGGPPPAFPYGTPPPQDPPPQAAQDGKLTIEYANCRAEQDGCRQPPRRACPA